MAKLEFSKMNGAGNDFVMLDNRAGQLQLSGAQIERLCDRHRGIGADGVLVIEPATNGADFRMRYYNADGGEAEMCGNGARCFARFANRLAGPREKVSFETPAGVIAAALEGEGVTLQMSEPRDMRLNLRIDIGRVVTCHYIDSGVPHVVIFETDLEQVDVRAVGALVRNHPEFAPRGANVNFLEKCGADEIAIRTYERGVEDETLACGTGVVASALLFCATEGAASPVRVHVKGGDELRVGFNKAGDRFTNVTLSGPADFVFEGTVEI